MSITPKIHPAHTPADPAMIGEESQLCVLAHDLCVEMLHQGHAGSARNGLIRLAEIRAAIRTRAEVVGCGCVCGGLATPPEAGAALDERLRDEEGRDFRLGYTSPELPEAPHAPSHARTRPDWPDPVRPGAATILGGSPLGHPLGHGQRGRLAAPLGVGRHCEPPRVAPAPAGAGAGAATDCEEGGEESR